MPSFPTAEGNFVLQDTKLWKANTQKMIKGQNAAQLIPG